jgi:hypothetical protein
MRLALGLAVCVAGIGWMKFGAYYPDGGIIIVMIGAYIMLRNKINVTLKKK